MNKIYTSVLLILLQLLLVVQTQAQQQSDIGSISISYKNEPLKIVLQDIQKMYQVKLFYKEEWLEGVIINQAFENNDLLNVISSVAEKAKLSAIQYDPHTIILIPLSYSEIKALQQAPVAMPAVDRLVTLSGYVQNSKSKEASIGSSVLIEELKKGTVTDENGYFTLSIPAGNYTLVVKGVGMVPEKRKLNLLESRNIDVELFEVSNQLREVEISAVAQDWNVSSLEMGVARLSIKEIKSVPSFLGEVDVVRSILAMPGVTTVGEGATGFNVRGGSIDQNLILQDDIPLFNSSHLLGFFSVFNPDMVKDVTLHRGGISSRYGGRVSSVLDVKMKDGNRKAPVVSGGIGLLSSRLMLEGPVVKDKVSFVVGGRAAYPDWLFRYVPDMTVRQSSGYFYDLNGKISAWLGTKDQLTIASYFSRDGFRFGADTTYTWGTATGSINWNHTFSDKFSAGLTGAVADYTYGVSAEEVPYNFDLNSGIRYKLAKLDFLFQPNLRHRVNTGGSIHSYIFNSGDFRPGSAESVLQAEKMPLERSAEASLYLEHIYELSPRIALSYGLRYSAYFNLGPGDVLIYNPEKTRSKAAVIDTVSYGSGHVIQKYTYPEPRLSVKITIKDNSSLKIGYNRMVQYTHLISNTMAASPADIWKISTTYLKPQIGDQVTLGYFHNLQQNTIELSAEVYYKHLQNIVEYKNGAKLLLNPALEADLLTGNGKAYGLELMLRRKEKSLTGWVSYTYSRTLRQVNGGSRETQLNEGEFYPANHDKPHHLTLVLNQKMGRRFSLGANFSYSTGRPVTYPESVSMVDGFLMVNYSDRNQYRIPDYHRLDLSLSIEGNNRRNSKLQGTWVFSVYNLYSRSNPYSVFFKPLYNGNVPQAYKLAVIGAAVPAISYNFRIAK